MTDIEQKALELVNALSVTDGYKDILRVPNSFLAKVLYHALEAHELDKSRHAAEMREQAERFSERDERLGEALYGLSARLLLDGWFEEKANHEAYEKVVAAFGKPFILAPVDPLVEVVDEVFDCNTRHTVEELAADLRAALDARGLAIVKKEAVNGIQ